MLKIQVTQQILMYNDRHGSSKNYDEIEKLHEGKKVSLIVFRKQNN